MDDTGVQPLMAQCHAALARARSADLGVRAALDAMRSPDVAAVTPRVGVDRSSPMAGTFSGLCGSAHCGEVPLATLDREVP